MRKQILFTLITLFSITSVFAQFGMKKKVKNAKLLKERILLVPVEDSEFGQRLKSTVEDIWTYHEKIKFITPEELKVMRKNRKERKAYAVLYFFEAGRRTNYTGNAVKIGFLERKKPVHYVITSSVHVNLKPVSKNEKENTNKADLVFAVEQLQQQLVSLTKYKKTKRKEIVKMLKEHNDTILKKLKTKTLLIGENFFSKKGLKEFKKNYKYDYKIVSKEVIDDAIVNSYDDKFYIKGIAQVSIPLKNSRKLTNNSPMTVVTYSIYDSVTNKAIYIFLSSNADLKFSRKDLKKFINSID